MAVGEFLLAENDGETAGTIKFQLEDPEIWPDVPAGESAFIHRLAVRRRFAGQSVSTALLKWSVERGLAEEKDICGWIAWRTGRDCGPFTSDSAFNSTASVRSGRIWWRGMNSMSAPSRRDSPAG